MRLVGICIRRGEPKSDKKRNYNPCSRLRLWIHIMLRKQGSVKKKTVYSYRHSYNST